MGLLAMTGPCSACPGPARARPDDRRDGAIREHPPRKPARLTVVPMKGWTRDRTWSDTGLPWVRPSPNLRSAEARPRLPGVGVAGVHERFRRTRHRRALPHVRRAPWLDAAGLLAALSVPGSPSSRCVSRRAPPRPRRAKYLDQDCAGVRIHVTDARAADPYLLGVTLLDALRRTQPAFRWRDDGAGLDRLLGRARYDERWKPAARRPQSWPARQEPLRGGRTSDGWPCSIEAGRADLARCVKKLAHRAIVTVAAVRRRSPSMSVRRSQTSKGDRP